MYRRHRTSEIDTHNLIVQQVLDTLASSRQLPSDSNSARACATCTAAASLAASDAALCACFCSTVSCALPRSVQHTIPDQKTNWRAMPQMLNTEKWNHVDVGLGDSHR
eukprot:3247328-Amphidinium_carterae.1